MRDFQKRGDKMLIQSLLIFLNDPIKLTASISSLILAILILILIKKKNFNIKTKIVLIYLHLFLFLFPFILFGYSLSCDVGLLNALISHCATAITKAFIYSLPFVIMFAASLGYVVIPQIFVKNNKELKNKTLNKFIKSYSEKLKIKTPRLYIIDIAKPIAFSFSMFKSAIFLSIGMTELLTKKELQTVLLHEMSHIKNRSSLLKFSSFLIKFSPFSYFTSLTNELNKEELNADEYAVKMQKTSKYLVSVKKKLNIYNNRISITSFEDTNGR